jgi:hypothetical protein
MPKYIQLQRTRGWRKPENTVLVSRPLKYGNPYKAGDPYNFRVLDEFEDDIADKLFRKNGFNILKYSAGGLIADAAEAVQLYKLYLEFIQAYQPEKWQEMVNHLKGKNLACWCKTGKNTPCHAKVLLAEINKKS